jgi:dihydropteroate synthase
MPQCTVNGISIGSPAPVRIMGVINCSPESFFTGSYIKGGDITGRALEMAEAGTHIIDIGGRSTAPRAPPVSISCEIERMEAALRELEGSGITISVDTMHPAVLARCLRYDIHAINDISGLANGEYAKIVADSGLPAFLMASLHRPGDSTDLKGTIHAMQTVVSRCSKYGIEEYVLDPAIGLWTSSRDVSLDWEICRRFSEFVSFNRPLLAAVSRKTFLGDLLDQKDPAERLPGTIALTVLLLKSGADIVRCHDVRETADLIRVFDKMEPE